MSDIELTASQRLLNLTSASLLVRRDPYGRYTVEYGDDSWAKDGIALVARWGIGATFEEACEDYLTQISGKTLVFHPGGINERRVTVL